LTKSTSTIQAELIKAGVNVAHYDAMEAFSEGATSGSLVQKIPGLGQVAQAYNQYLFHDFIPRMKMTMATHAFERNLKRYSGKMSRDRIASLTADQANAAFGELNYRKMGRNPTFQDFLRMTLLAPDFLEARGRFVGQALKPFGREQSRALITGAVALYVMARIVNQNVSGDPHWDKPFSVVVKGKEYRLRTVQGDIEHLVRDPQNFAWVRLNPTTTKPLMTGLFGRDEYGRPISVKDIAQDTATGAIPISLQKRIRNPLDFSLLDSMLQAVGVSNSKFYTKGAKEARDYVFNSIPKDKDTSTVRAQSMKIRKLEKDFAEGDLTAQQLHEKLQRGDITEKQLKRVTGPEAQQSSVEIDFKRLPIEKALEFWPNYSDDERKLLRPLLAKKAATISRLDRTASQKRALAEQARAALTPKEK
jgi:hypothetical protein